MTRYLSILLVLVTLLGCQEPFLGDGETGTIDEESMKLYTGWSANGTLSSEDLAGRSVHLQANFQNDGNQEDASGYTVQFSVGPKRLIAPIIGTTFGNITPTADIVWSVEGNEVRRTVSVVNGLSVSGVGQGCKVEIYDETPAADVGQATEYDVSVLLVPGVRPATQQVPYYAPLGIDVGGVLSFRPGSAIVPPGGTGILTVPQDIGATAVCITASTGQTTPVILTDLLAQAQHINFGGNIVKAYNPTNLGWVPLHPHTDRIFLYNLQAAGPGVPNIVFTLLLGIDG